MTDTDTAENITNPDAPTPAEPLILTAATCYARAAATLFATTSAGSTPQHAAALAAVAAQWTELGDRLRDDPLPDQIAWSTLADGHLTELAELARWHPGAFAAAVRDLARAQEEIVRDCRADEADTRDRLQISDNALHAAHRDLDQMRVDLDEARRDYLKACETIAAMHAAAVGEVRGPARGVVEDVADVRTELQDALGRLLEQQLKAAEHDRLIARLARRIRELFADRIAEGTDVAGVACDLITEYHDLRDDTRVWLEQADATSAALATATAELDKARQVANNNHGEAVAYAGQLTRLLHCLRDRFPLLWMRMVTDGPSNDRDKLVDHVAALLDDAVRWARLVSGGVPAPGHGQQVKIDGRRLVFTEHGWQPVDTDDAGTMTTAPPATVTVHDGSGRSYTSAGPVLPSAPADAPPVDAILRQAAQRAAERDRLRLHTHPPKPF